MTGRPPKRYRIGATSLRAVFFVCDDGGTSNLDVVIMKRSRELHRTRLAELDVARHSSAILCVDADADVIRICPVNPLAPDILLPVSELPPEVSEIVLAEWDSD